MTNNNYNTEENRLSFLKIWWIAGRPFSFPASLMPVVFGTALAVVIGEVSFNFWLFAVSLVGIVLIHAGANVLNDVYDFEKGLDREVLPISGAVVRGLLSPRAALKGSIILFISGSALGIWIAVNTSWLVFIIGFVGVSVGIIYSATPLGLKYHGLGDLSVFLNFGILGTLGAWVVQTAQFSWIPVLWSLPIALLVVGILHANNWRDMQSDTAQGYRTVASLLGDNKSELYYGFLLFAPFAVVLGLILVPRVIESSPAMPLTFLLTFLALPLAWRLNVKGQARANPRHPLDFLALDGATAQLNLLFGLLCTAALILDSFI